MKNARKVLVAVIAIAVALFWWFVVTDWIAKPRSYRAGVFYVACVVVSSGWHFRALYRFNKMVRLVRAEEAAGAAADGSTLFAVNQRFRYMLRSFEAFVVLTIGIVAILAVANPSIGLNVNYIRLVLTYFVWSIILTGYLTYRDLAVIDKVKKLNSSDSDDAILVAPKKGNENGTKP